MRCWLRLARSPRTILLVGLTVALAVPTSTVGGGPPISRTFVPIGSGYGLTTLRWFALAAAQHDTTGNIYLLVLPITYATDPYSISDGERYENLTLAEARRSQIEAACRAVKRADQTCRAVLAPILVRDDAYLKSNLDLFTADLDGIYFLGGDQTIAMSVVANTPTEQLMASAYSSGVVISGNSAGAAVESLQMIAGFTGNNGPKNGLQQGSVDLWTFQGGTDLTRGLIFGLPNAVLDQHEYQRGRIGRLINTAWSTGLLGIGLDANTGATIQNEATLMDVSGYSSVFVVDIRTFAATGRYAGPTNTLAVHRVATHLIPPGGYGYDLSNLRPLVNGQPQPMPDITKRVFPDLGLPEGNGALLLGGDIGGDKQGRVAGRFVALAGGANARLVVIGAGYAKNDAALADAKAFATAFQSLVTSPVQGFVLDSRADAPAIQNAVGNASGIFITAPDQSTVLDALDAAPDVLNSIREAWNRGATLMADDAAAAALGQFLSADPPPTAGSLEDDSINDFFTEGVDVRSGLRWVIGLTIEPRLLPNRRWGRMYNHLYCSPSVLSVGIDVNTAVEFNQSGAFVRGLSAAVVLDGRHASFDVGSNGALSARYVVLDSYVEGDSITP